MQRATRFYLEQGASRMDRFCLGWRSAAVTGGTVELSGTGCHGDGSRPQSPGGRSPRGTASPGRTSGAGPGGAATLLRRRRASEGRRHERGQIRAGGNGAGGIPVRPAAAPRNPSGWVSAARVRGRPREDGMGRGRGLASAGKYRQLEGLFGRGVTPLKNSSSSGSSGGAVSLVELELF